MLRKHVHCGVPAVGYNAHHAPSNQLQRLHPARHKLTFLPAVPQLPRRSIPEREHLAIAGEHCSVTFTAVHKWGRETTGGGEDIRDIRDIRWI